MPKGVQNRRKTSDSRQNSTTKSQHAEGKCGKKHAKNDDFSSKFEHRNFDTPKVSAAKSTPKSMNLKRPQSDHDVKRPQSDSDLKRPQSDHDR